MGKPCQYVFRYNGGQSSEEVVLDMGGAMSLPGKGQIIQRKGMKWKVVQVSTQQEISARPAIPVHIVSLSSDLTLAI